MECNEEIFKKGKAVCMIDGKGEAIQNFVNKISESSGVKVDWHWMGGRGIVKTMLENMRLVSDKIREYCMDEFHGIYQIKFYPYGVDSGGEIVDFEQKRRERYAKNINR